MKKVFVGFLAFAVLVGCGGGGRDFWGNAGDGGSQTGGGGSGGGTNGDGGGTTGGGSTGDGSTGGSGGGTGGGSNGDGSTGGGAMAIVPSSTPGQLDVNVLTGLGRAPSVFVDINQVSFARVGASALVSNFAAKRIGLDGYTHDLITVSAGSTPATQEYSSMSFRIDKMLITGQPDVSGPLTTTAPLKARTSRGRVTSIRLMLDDSMFYADPGLKRDDFLFQFANTELYGGSLASFYSDLVRLDISGVAERPLLGNGSPAKFLYMSGDIYGISSDTVSSLMAYFGINRNLDFEAVRSGTFSGTGPGSYSLNEQDPRDPSKTIKRLQGTWTNLGSVVSNIGSFAMLSFPSSNPLQSDQLLMIARSGGSITECYIGELNKNTSTFVAHPVRDLGSPVPSIIGGTINDTAVGGTFAIDFGTKPDGFPSTGSYLRFIR